MTPRTATVMNSAEWGMLVTLSVVWGGTFFLVEIALIDLPPLTVVLGRVSIAALTLLILVHARGLRMPASLRGWAPLLGMGLLNNLLPFSLIFWAQTQLTGGLASILNATTPLFAVILAHFLTTDERMTPGRVTGVLLGMTGVAIIIGLDAFTAPTSNVLPQLACLAAALCYALAGIFGRRFILTPPLVTAAGQLSASTIFVLPLVLLVERPWTLPLPSAQGWAALAGLALVCTAAAYVLFFRILATAGATNLMLVTLLIPVSAMLLGGAILGEAIEAQHLAGMGLIGLGLAVIDGRPVAAARRVLLRATPD